MNNDNSADQSKFSLALNLQVATGYVMCVAAAYHLGYWRNFNVSIFQFMTVSDFTRLAVWPILSLSGSLLFGFFARAFQTQRLPGITPRNSAKAAVEDRTDRFYGGFAIATTMGLSLSTAFTNSPIFRFLLSVLLAIGSLTIVLPHFELHKLPHELSQSVLMTSVFVLFLTWGYAKTTAVGILMGTQYTRAFIPESERLAAGLTDAEELRFIANTDSYSVFLIGGGPSILVVPHDKLSGMILKPVTNPVTYQPVKDWFIKIGS